MQQHAALAQQHMMQTRKSAATTETDTTVRSEAALAVLAPPEIQLNGFRKAPHAPGQDRHSRWWSE